MTDSESTRSWAVVGLVAGVLGLGACASGPPGVLALRGHDLVVPVVVSVDGSSWSVRLKPVVVGVPSEARVQSREILLAVADGGGRELVRLTRDDPRWVYVDEGPERSRILQRAKATFIVFIPYDAGIKTIQLKGQSPRLAALDLTFHLQGHLRPVGLIAIP